MEIGKLACRFRWVLAVLAVVGFCGKGVEFILRGLEERGRRLCFGWQGRWRRFAGG